MKNIVYSFLIVSLFFACHSQKNIAGNYIYKSECAGITNDGKQMIKAWGNGLNKKEAIEDAKKTALKDILFNGIYNGFTTCSKIPILTEINAAEKHKAYFDKFFSPGGRYKSFVKEREKGKIYKADKKKSRFGKVYGVFLIVESSELEEELTKKDIKKN